MTGKSFLFFLLISLYTVSVWAGSYDHIKARYPSNTFIVGIAEVQVSGDVIKDRRRAEILARLEIAKQIRVRIKEETVDIMCESYGKALFPDLSECRNHIVMVVEETVDEVLEGSRIVDIGEDRDRGIFYAVAILPRKDASSKAEDGFKEAIDRTKESLDKAKASEDDETKKDHLQRAKEELKKSMAYGGERLAIEGTRDKAEEMLKELAEEIKNLTPSAGLENSP